MMYPNLFRSRHDLKGRDWVTRLPLEDLRVFVDIGLQAAEHGHKGGVALVAKRGKEYMREIGRRGALITNIKKQWKKVVMEEMEYVGKN